MKYVIKNCSALRWSRRHFKCCSEYSDFKKCEDREDCLIKQIVELCKKALNSDDCYERMYGGKMCCQPILDLLDVEEVE